ncbi:hypothetical protein SDC9_195547 [bioreactor metagenome]|uniref:Uncharacterized protein n=1 Tax=bioreactor metagenome TaxID=1076179 RepID=A0A645IKU2_9ZZZZ
MCYLFWNQNRVQAGVIGKGHDAKGFEPIGQINILECPAVLKGFGINFFYIFRNTYFG